MAGIDADWIRWGMAGMGTLSLFLAGLLIKRVEEIDRSARQRSEDLWTEINALNHADAEARVDHEQRFATKQDVEKLGERIDKRFDRHEQSTTTAIEGQFRQMTTLLMARNGQGG